MKRLTDKTRRKRQRQTLVSMTIRTVRTSAGLAPFAGKALQRITALYEMRKGLRGHVAAERREARQEKTRPLIIAPRTLREKRALVSQKTKLAEAIRYALSP